MVTDSKEEVIKKRNKRAAKRKERLEKFCALIRSSLTSRSKSSLFLIPRLMSTLVPAFMAAPMPTCFFNPRSFVDLLSYYIPTFVSRPGSYDVSLSHYIPTPAVSTTLSLPCATPDYHPRSFALFSFCLLPAPVVSCYGILALLLPLPILDLSLPPKSLPLRIFK